MLSSTSTASGSSFMDLLSILDLPWHNYFGNQHPQTIGKKWQCTFCQGFQAGVAAINVEVSAVHFETPCNRRKTKYSEWSYTSRESHFYEAFHFSEKFATHPFQSSCPKEEVPLGRTGD